MVDVVYDKVADAVAGNVVALVEYRRECRRRADANRNADGHHRGGDQHEPSIPSEVA
jgi:hypothetical protein